MTEKHMGHMHHMDRDPTGGDESASLVLHTCTRQSVLRHVLSAFDTEQWLLGQYVATVPVSPAVRGAWSR